MTTEEASNDDLILKKADDEVDDEVDGSTDDKMTDEGKNDEMDNVSKAEEVVEKDDYKSPSMSVSLFLTWILPVLIIAVFSRYSVDTEPPPVKVSNRPISIDTSSFETVRNPSLVDKFGGKMSSKRKKKKKKKQQRQRSNTDTVPVVSSSVKHPTSYRLILDDIDSRKRLWKPIKASSSVPDDSLGVSKEPTRSESPKKQSPSRSSKSSKMSKSPASLLTRDPERRQLEALIEKHRRSFASTPSVLNAVLLADALRVKDATYHDGGMGQEEAIDAYQFAINKTLEKKAVMAENGEATNISLSGTTSAAEELMLDYSQKSVDGLLCAIYTSMAKTMFMGNMFERADQAYSACIEIEPLYLDAVTSRGTCKIILGDYEAAGQDFISVLENDTSRLFKDAYTGLAKVLVAKEAAVPAGWGPLLERLEPLIAEYEAQMMHTSSLSPEFRRALADALSRLHHVAFTYHDAKTKDRLKAWDHLTKAYEYKMSNIEPYNFAQESQKLAALKGVFAPGFWPLGIGSLTNVPIFIIGFVRSGSTLLERVLDAHPMIVGTGENSVFNGRLDYIRNEIVRASGSGDPEDLNEVVNNLADSVVHDMRQRWITIEANSEPQSGSKKDHVNPQRFADKMLTNYLNVGFIHMLFPNALILHVARNPMDVLWSAYKHEFPSGGLDYTSEFKSLANMYHIYRDIIQHWDEVLPGRVTHVRYEDMVGDMPGMAKAIIHATGLPWDESVLSFHKKKHAVNTLSTSQVRKGVYKDSLEAWREYEPQLQRLSKLVGVKAKWDLKTTLPTYVPPSQEVE